MKFALCLLGFAAAAFLGQTASAATVVTVIGTNTDDPTLIQGLPDGNASYNPATGTISGGSNSSLSSQNGGYAQSSVSFVLDLTALGNSTLTTGSSLVNFDGNSADLGLWAQANGDVTGSWTGNAWTSGGTVSNGSLNANAGGFTVNGNQYLALTVVTGSTGTYLYAAGSSTPLLSMTGLKTDKNTGGFANISFNKDFIAAISVSNGSMTAAEAEAFAGSLQEQFLASVPEPGTATLGMLGLAALLMRRRRNSAGA